MTMSHFAAARIIAAALAVGALGSGVAAQPIPMPVPPMGPMAPMMSPEQLQADLRARAGTDTIRFDRDSFMLDAAARASLGPHSMWLVTHPMVKVSIEGHADVRQSRDHALALGERRAAAVRNFLLTQGVAPGQMDVVSWGRERPAASSVHDAAWLQNGRVVIRVTR